MKRTQKASTIDQSFPAPFARLLLLWQHGWQLEGHPDQGNIYLSLHHFYLFGRKN